MGQSFNRGVITDAPASIQLDNPRGIFVSNGEVFIADAGNHRVRKLLEHVDKKRFQELLWTTIPSSCPTHTIIPLRKWIEMVTILCGSGIKGFSGDVPFDFGKWPHVGPRRKKPLIRPFPKAYHDVVFVYY